MRPNTVFKYGLIAALALMGVVLLAAPAMACPPTCPPGEVWGMIEEGHYGPWHGVGYCNIGDTDTCRRTCDDWHHCPGWLCHCDDWDYEHRHYVEPVYGCIATFCPAIPCESGYTCQDNQCVPDVCGVDFQCAQGYHCRDNTCVRTDTFSPYTESACQAVINAQYPMDSTNPSTLPLLPLKNTYVSAAFKYASRFDCVDLAYYTKGEPSFSRDCTEVEWYNRVQEEIHIYGGMPILTALNPAQAICVLAVKNSPSETTLPVTITITDSHGTVGDVITSSDPVIRQCYQLPEDFSECRVH